MGTGKARTFVDLMNAIGSSLGHKVNIDFVDIPESICPSYQYFTESNSQKLNSLGALGDMGYPKELKQKVLVRMMAPGNEKVSVLAREFNVTEATLYAWRRSALETKPNVPHA